MKLDISVFSAVFGLINLFGAPNTYSTPISLKKTAIAALPAYAREEKNEKQKRLKILKKVRRIYHANQIHVG